MEFMRDIFQEEAAAINVAKHNSHDLSLRRRPSMESMGSGSSIESMRSGLSTIWLDTSTTGPPVICAWPFGTPRFAGQSESRARYKTAVASASPSSPTAATVRSQQALRHPLISYQALGYNLRERPIREVAIASALSRLQAARRLQAESRVRFMLKTSAAITIQAEARRRDAAARARARRAARRRFDLRTRLRAVLFVAKLRHAVGRRRRLSRAAMPTAPAPAAVASAPKKQEPCLHKWAAEVLDEEKQAAAELALLIKRARPKKKPNPEAKRFRPRISLMIE